MILSFLRSCLAACASTVLLAACSSSPTAQHTPPAAHPACPDLAQWPAARLHGLWLIELPDLGQQGQLLLRQHPEFRASLRGELLIDGQPSIASGDLEQGELNLDESRDGKSLYAFWTGQLQAEPCGQQIHGHWESLPKKGQASRSSRFILRRADHSTPQVPSPPAGRW